MSVKTAMRTRKASLLLFCGISAASFGAGGCDKSSHEASGDGGAHASGATSATAASSAATSSHVTTTDAGSSADPVANAPQGSARTFSGKYVITPATMYVPTSKDWSAVKFKNDTQKMLGDGEISISVDPGGRVSGAASSGPLGAAILDGTMEGGIVTATVRRKDPSDEGLTGTLEAKASGDKLSGTLKLAESNAAVVREGTLTASAK